MLMFCILVTFQLYCMIFVIAITKKMLSRPSLIVNEMSNHSVENSENVTMSSLVANANSENDLNSDSDLNSESGLNSEEEPNNEQNPDS